MKQELDCRGLACPHPVLKTKELLDAGAAELTVWVDNPAARDNVSRFLTRSGFEVAVAEAGGDFAVTGRRLDPQPGGPGPSARREAPSRKILVLIGTDRLGTGDDVLGRKLLANFLGTLREMGPELWCVVCLNAGVKLTVADSEVLPALRELAAAGVMVLVCGTCLNHFGLLEAKAVGETTNMLDIVTHLQLADKVISLT